MTPCQFQPTADGAYECSACGRTVKVKVLPIVARCRSVPWIQPAWMTIAEPVEFALSASPASPGSACCGPSPIVLPPAKKCGCGSPG